MTDPSIVLDETGRGLLTWRDGNAIFARRYDADTGSWGPYEVVEYVPGEPGCEPVALAMTADGRAVAAWAINNDNVYGGYALYRWFDFVNGWSPYIGGADGMLAGKVSGLSAAIGGFGEAFLSFVSTPHQGRTSSVVGVKDSQTPGPNNFRQKVLSGGLEAAVEPALSADDLGNAVVVWKEGTMIHTDRYQSGR